MADQDLSALDRVPFEDRQERITSEIQRSGKTISDLLELARNKQLKRVAVEARQFLAHAVSVANLPPGVGVAVEAREGMVVDADPDQLTRVVTNLLINASQAMNGKGHIRIDARREGVGTILRVQDDGPGVPANLRDRVYVAAPVALASLRRFFRRIGVELPHRRMMERLLYGAQ